MKKLKNFLIMASVFGFISCSNGNLPTYENQIAQDTLPSITQEDKTGQIIQAVTLAAFCLNASMS